MTREIRDTTFMKRNLGYGTWKRTRGKSSTVLRITQRSPGRQLVRDVESFKIPRTIINGMKSIGTTYLARVFAGRVIKDLELDDM